MKKINASAVHNAVAQFIDSGWSVVPVHHGEKRPRGTAWQKLRLTKTDIAKHFSKDSNIGVLLGEPSNSLIDIDFDHEAALACCHLMPATSMCHGRPSNPELHYWYRVTDTPLRTIKFKDPDGSMLLELRSTGAQTVVPTSVYKTDKGTGASSARFEQLRRMRLARWRTAGRPWTQI